MKKEDFCNFEQSKALKELGFDEECISHYSNEGILVNSGYSVFNNMQLIYCAAPLRYQAFRFFRDKFGLIGFVMPFQDGSLYFTVYTPQKSGILESEGFYPKSVVTKDWQVAESACIDKLIELAGEVKK